jgi:predicted GNAT superfamily acetyltransferase
VAGIEEAGEERGKFPTLASRTWGTIAIRRCSGVDEMQMCVELQKEVWGFSDIELVPLRLFVVADKVGGQVIGAFDGGDLVGFVMSIPGIRKVEPPPLKRKDGLNAAQFTSYLHSHMLAVREAYRDKGLGRRIKLFQREDALASGIDLIEWTFDPLEIKNAYLNLEKLGAIARRYNVNQYGITTSPLQGGLPTDRLVAEWWLRSQRVETTLRTGKRPAVKAEQTVSIPADVYEWKKSAETRGKALEVQSAARETLLKAFGEGLACVGYERDERGNGKFLVGKWDGERG